MKLIVKNRFRRQNGFTLVEMAMVILVIGIMLAVSIPVFARYFESQRLDGAFQQLSVDLQHARSLARSNHRTFVIQFQQHGYQLIDTDDGSVIRDQTTSDRITFAASTDPQFYSWGMADPANITITGSRGAKSLNLLSTGNVVRP